jgi:hypothetical protein
MKEVLRITNKEILSINSIDGSAGIHSLIPKEIQENKSVSWYDDPKSLDRVFYIPDTEDLIPVRQIVAYPTS